MTYREYLDSSEWDIRRGMFIERAGGQCNRCNAVRNLQVHHRHYKTLGEENYKDVEVLCQDCHRSHHGK